LADLEQTAKDLAPDLTEELLRLVDVPLKKAHDPLAHRDYLLCDYNRDGDSYRSPWTNTYDPPLEDGVVPSDKLRDFEVQANEIFDIYRELYYEGGTSSVYCWDVDNGFAASVLLKKTQDQSKKGEPMRGTWDSIHVVEVEDNQNGISHYRLTSTVMLSLETQNEFTGQVSLSGSLQRQEEKDFQVNDQNPHVINMGKMIEDMEFKLRTTIETIYFGKTKDITNELRQATSISILKDLESMQKKIGSAMQSS